MKSLLAITKALSDPNRVRILLMLRDRELCVCQIIEILNLAPSTVSKHLALLSQADLILTRKAGRWIHCRLPSAESAGEDVTGALAWVFAAASREPTIRSDAKRLRKILSMTPEQLCQRQSARREGACCDADCK